MNPYERAVVEAAIAWRHDFTDRVRDTFLDALDALIAHRAQSEPTEMEITWGEVVTEDEVFIPATGRWWPVIATKRPQRKGGRMSIVAKGAPKILTPEPSTPVKVRRGKSGQAVDTLITVLMSGPNTMRVSEE